MKTFNIAIDGPAGAGKSTIAKRVASQLGYIYVDTGAMYRAVGLYCIENNIPPTQIEAVENAIELIQVSIRFNEGEQQVLLNQRNVNALIRSNEVSTTASIISAYPNIREKMVEIQRELAHVENVVMDGRDIGTHVLKDATLKIYMSASVEIRAKRRWLELHERGEEVDFQELKNDIEKRDFNDMNREFSPLQQADDAILLDTSEMSIHQVVEEILCFFNQKRLEKNKVEGD